MSYLFLVRQAAGCLCALILLKVQEPVQPRPHFMLFATRDAGYSTYGALMLRSMTGCWTTTARCLCRSCRRLCGRTRTSCSLPRKTRLARTAAARCEPNLF